MSETMTAGSSRCILEEIKAVVEGRAVVNTVKGELADEPTYVFLLVTGSDFCGQDEGLCTEELSRRGFAGSVLVSTCNVAAAESLALMECLDALIVMSAGVIPREWLIERESSRLAAGLPEIPGLYVSGADLAYSDENMWNYPLPAV